MKPLRHLPILLLAVLFGLSPAVGPYLHELTVVKGHGRQFQGPVVMYGTRWCPYCRAARQYFERHDFDYVEYDIEASTQNMANFRSLGGRGVPLILAGGERMEGFSPRSFDALVQ